MSNFNKVVTNIPVSLTETEMSNLSQTFSGIIQGGGGGGEGKRYIGDGVYVTVNNDANPGVISLTQTSLDKLNKEIPSAVSSFPDSVQYAKKTYVDGTFQTKDDMSAYATTAYVNGVTGSIYYTNIQGLVEALNAKQDKLTFGYDENEAISSINSHKLAGQGGVTGDYYSASNPSGFINSVQAETQILEKHYLTEASGNSLYVPIPEGLSDGQYYAMTTSSWKVIQGAGDVSGISTVAHDDTLTGNGNNENLGVDTTKIQTKLTDAEIQNITDVTTLKTASSTWNNVSAKLNTAEFNTYTATTAPATYQPLGNYLSSNALEGYATTAMLDTISSKIENDIPTTVAQLTDSANYYKKSETSGATEITNALGNKVDKPSSLQNKYLVLRTDNAGNVSGWVDFNDNVYSKSESDGRYQKKEDMGNYLTTAKYATDSATFYPTTNPDGYLTKTDTDTYYQPTGYYATSAGLTTGNQYAMTTNGWEIVQAGTSFTGVVTGTGLSGTGLSNSPLGVDTTAAIYFTNGSAKSAVSAESATNALSSRYSKQLQDASKIIQISDITALQNWASSNSATWDAVSAKLTTAQYANDSATFVTSSNSIITGTKQYALTTTGWESVETAYLPLTGGTVTGQMTLTGNSWDNRLTIGRSNSAIDIGVASNGALTLKANTNNACQFNMMQTGNSGVDINITYGQTPSAIGNLYVMKTHTIADATTASGSWNGDNLLHIILDS